MLFRDSNMQLNIMVIGGNVSSDMSEWYPNALQYSPGQEMCRRMGKTLQTLQYIISQCAKRNCGLEEGGLAPLSEIQHCFLN